MNSATIPDTDAPIDFTTLWQVESAKDPLSWHLPGQCRYCGKEIPPPHVVTSENGFFSLPIVSCDACIVDQLAIREL